MGTGSTEKLRFNFIRDERILRVSQKAGSAIQLSVDISEGMHRKSYIL